jgi:hypothetical protein
MDLRQAVMIALLVSLAETSAAAAQSSSDRPPARPEPAQPQVACPPDVQTSPPTVGGAPSPNLSDRLADSKGIICPPAGVDRDINVPPPGGGELKVIPPPGSPGGNPNVQPK